MTDCSDNAVPRMPAVRSDLIACEHCDALWVRAHLQAGQQMRCGRCDAVLGVGERVGLSGQLALVIAGLIVFLIANVFPIVVLEIQGLRHDSTLLQAIVILARHDALPVAIVAAVTVFVCPLIELLCRCWALLAAMGRRRTLGAHRVALAMRIYSRVEHWSMTEVYMIGMLVTLVKIGSMAQIIPGVGLAGFGVLTLLISATRVNGNHAIWASVPASFHYLDDEPDADVEPELPEPLAPEPIPPGQSRGLA